MLYLGIILFFTALCIYSISEDSEATVPVFFVLLLLSIPWLYNYSKHADNIATIQEQHRVINVYEKRVLSLSDKMKTLSTGDINQALLNADTPISAMVQAITKFEMKLAEAEELKAVAYKRLTARKLGFVNSVTWFFDEIEEKE